MAATETAGRSVLAAGTRVVGDIDAPGHLELQGRVEGRVTAESVVIEDRGSVGGEVEGTSVAVRGAFDGRLMGGTVRIHATARVSGTVTYVSLMIESGAEVTAGFDRVAPDPPPEGPAPGA